ncbi:LysE family transporter [Streptomyces sp. H27-D2]|uniref:LysE family transporter n=1 Tax=Streptomyces sp. H27-D2 TaxID=3046304 RepID=UPI002DC059D9|nr:LysE family transporter [Streptomyces sp. H27-D2]MEC4014747.1 LysE family transporter [Streptomyces sp. H27-D2]
MIGAIAAGLWAGYGLAVPVGAVAVSMVSLTARSSFRVGAAAAAGAATADACYAVAAVLGGNALASTVRPFMGLMRWIASTILMAMALRIVVTAIRHRHDSSGASGPRGARITPFRAYVTYLGLTALNPWPAIYFVALMLGRQVAVDMSPAEQIGYLSAVVAASASWQLLLAGGGTVLGRALTGRRGRLATALLSGAVIGSLAIAVLLPH